MFVHGGVSSEVPVEPVIANTESYLASHPDDARAHYVLARTQSLAYAINDDRETGRIFRKSQSS